MVPSGGALDVVSEVMFTLPCLVGPAPTQLLSKITSVHLLLSNSIKRQSEADRTLVGYQTCCNLNICYMIFTPPMKQI